MTRRRAFCGTLAASLLAGPAARSGSASAADAPDAAIAVAPTYFGMHFHRLIRNPGDPMPTEWPEQARIGSVRLWDSGTRWADVAPNPGRWDFDRMDAYVSRASAHGATVLHTLGSTPRWASSRPDEPGPYGPGCAAEPQRMSDWEDYLLRLVGRYRGRVQAYELWNEPAFSDIERDRGKPGFFTGSVATMVAMGRVARRVIDAVDPKALLSTPGFVAGPDRLALFLGAGGAGLVDAVGYHFYSNGTARFDEQIREVRQVMRERGVSALPLWNTECGVEAESKAGPQGDAASKGELNAATLMAKLLLLGVTAGMERFYYYAWDNFDTGMIDRQGEPLPRLAAFVQIQKWLIGAQLQSPQRMSNGATIVWAQRATERFAFAWAERDVDLTLALPARWRATTTERLLDAPSPVAPAQGVGSLALRLSPRPVRVQLAATA